MSAGWIGVMTPAAAFAVVKKIRWHRQDNLSEVHVDSGDTIISKHSWYYVYGVARLELCNSMVLALSFTYVSIES